MCDLKCLEHSTLIVPYELLNKRFRLGQKSVERESSRVGCSAAELEQVLARPGVRADQLGGVVDGLLDRLRCLKRKASEAVDEEQAAAGLLKKRLLHLKEVAATSQTPGDLERWKRVRVDRFVIDYLLRAGYFETAQRLANHNNIRFLSNIDIFLKADEVEKGLEMGDTSKWAEWAVENKSKLRRVKSGLELNIRRQEFVELVKKGEKLLAVKFARKHFAELDRECWASLVPTMGLLALPMLNGKHVTTVGRYTDMFSEQRWRALVDEFRTENVRLFCLSQPVFSALLQSGLSVMKTPHCVKACREALGDQQQLRERRSGSASTTAASNGCFSRTTAPVAAAGRRQSLPPGHTLLSWTGGGGRDAQCPLCCGGSGGGAAQRLAAALPQAHAAQSRLVCALSGEAVNDANPPLALPNGMVYGHRALVRLAAEDAAGRHRVTCPRTGQLFQFTDAQRVFVM